MTIIIVICATALFMLATLAGPRRARKLRYTRVTYGGGRRRLRPGIAGFLARREGRVPETAMFSGRAQAASRNRRGSPGWRERCPGIAGVLRVQASHVPELARFSTERAARAEKVGDSGTSSAAKRRRSAFLGRERAAAGETRRFWDARRERTEKVGDSGTRTERRRRNPPIPGRPAARTHGATAAPSFSAAGPSPSDAPGPRRPPRRARSCPRG